MVLEAGGSEGDRDLGISAGAGTHQLGAGF